MARQATTLMTELPSGLWKHDDSDQEFESALECVNNFREKVGEEPYELMPAFLQNDEGQHIIS
jgi:hypothetical protein